MLYTPVALELARRCFLSAGGEDERPDTAESTLVSSDVSADMLSDDGRYLRIRRESRRLSKAGEVGLAWWMR